ncbi:kielin/chordin-like protein isoform X3 [Paramisgurnus dabryanus]|uniref:kielin/chordin-like protein isoform X3 n=1 Tax=Paramisgurnus dabryanus TaxID=90735 RepID=UPI0031F340E5
MKIKCVIGGFLAIFVLGNLCGSVQTYQDAKHPRADEKVINLLEALNATQSDKVASKVKGRDPGTSAWRFRSSTPHLTLPHDLVQHLRNTSQGVLGLHLVGRQKNNSDGTLISLTSPVFLKKDGRPLLKLISNTRKDWLLMQFRSAEGFLPELLKFPGGSPFADGGWVRMALNVEPRQLVLFVECQEAVVLKSKKGLLSLDLPDDLQVTFSSTAGSKAHKFNGLWQTAELSTRAYERRPWFCDNVTDLMQDPAQLTALAISPVSEMMNDQGHHEGGAELSYPPDTPNDSVKPYAQLDSHLHSINTMLDMLKKQNANLQARVEYLESCECVKRKCVWEGRQMDEGSRWSPDSSTVCLCTNGQVQCERMNECSFQGNIYHSGEVFSPDDCSKCTCENGRVECDVITCSASCTDISVPHESCCPNCLTRCEYEGESYRNGDVFVPRSNPCLKCSCTGGHVVCGHEPCPILPCNLVETVGGECCPRCRSCSHNNAWHLHGTQWQDPNDHCRTCTCTEGEVFCNSESCRVSCRNPASPHPGTCCPVCDGCNVNGRDIPNGHRLPPGPQCEGDCWCENGNIRCIKQPCPPTSCHNPIQRPGECCPRCEECRHEGQMYLEGESFVSRQDPCITCQCLGGQVTCGSKGCQAPQCTHPARSRDQCCPSCDMCEYEGRIYEDGREFRPPGDGPCFQCTCKGGNVRCHQERCPTLTCENPVPPSPNSCCPVCRGCEWNGVQYEEGASWSDGGRNCYCAGGRVTCDPDRPTECCGDSCGQCQYKQRIYENGQKFTDPEDPCTQCTCQQGQVLCAVAGCADPPCSNSYTPPGECCPRCPGCEWNGVQYEEGASWSDGGRNCYCAGGRVTCDPDRPTGGCCGDSCSQCQYKQRIYENGQTFTDPEDPCAQCTCQQGQVHCAVAGCPALSCSNPYTPPGECCQRCPGCEYNNQIFNNGDIFPNPTNPCEDCACIDGRVTCGSHECPQPNCNNPRQGTCCQNNCNGCSYAGIDYPNGMEFPHPTDHCRTCHCNNGNVQCLMKRCPPVQCADPYVEPGECCPQCPAPPVDCNVDGQVYRHMQHFSHPTDSCQSCSCLNGIMNCRRRPCPSAVCSHPIIQDCCRTCDGCLYEGREHANGATFNDASDPCTTCVCRDGTVRCERRPCLPVNCPFPVQGQCCPRCDGCRYAGLEYRNGQEFSDPADRCGLCVCTNGQVNCNRRPCHNPGCSHPITRPDQCCPVCDGCLYHERVYVDGEAFTSLTAACEECRCTRGDVRCYPKSCPEVRCSRPVRPPGQCCPVCTGTCEYQGQVYESYSTFSPVNDHCSICTCQNGEVTCNRNPQCRGCRYAGLEYRNGQEFSDPADRCGLCVCTNGQVNCNQRPCHNPGCSHPITRPDQCCPVCDGCLYHERVYVDGEAFTSLTAACEECRCTRGDVRCYPKSCPEVRCSRPVRPPGQCCPVCTGTCEYQGQVYESYSTFSPVNDHCSICTCQNGEVTCNRKPQCRVCHQNGREYLQGQNMILPANPCSKCTCMDGEVICVKPPCAELTCMHQITDPGSCCPRCRGCFYDGVEHSEGSTWFASSGPCMSCMCVDGVTTCSEVHCISTCLNQITVPGECCPVCADCVFEGRVYGPGESFHPSDDPCQICTCEVTPNGEQHLRCYRKQCPRLVDCPKHYIQYSSPDACCPVCAQPLSNCTATLLGNEVLATDDPCFTCQCKDLTWTCIHRGCPPLSCPQSEQHTSPDSCCPVCDECVLDGDKTRVRNGWRWTDKENECVTCVCNQGHIECDLQECPAIDCPDGSFKLKNPGKCCHECTDVTAVVYSIDISAQCVYDRRVYNHNDHWEVDECTLCTCVSGEVHCQTQRCPALTCASDETPTLTPGMCCPHCIPRPATCIVFGDPHYRTFDGKMVNFQGTCTYVLAQDCQGGDFSVHVSNEDRGRKEVSWTKEVTVFIGDVVVQLLQDWVVKVDYQPVSLPFLKEPYVYLERKTNTILLNTNVGLKVLWNGRSHLEVSVPGTYKKHMCGLCGNFNNYPQDDMRLRNGQIATSEAAFGNNWKDGSGNHSNLQCSDVRNIDPCKEAGYSSRKTANARCAVLKSPVFERCHKLVPPEMFFASCVYDLCACGSNMDQCLCEVLEAYASECREVGVVIQWRSPMLCAVGCPTDRGYVFDECGPPCPKTCFNKDVPLGVIESHCFKPCVPGCQCPAGLVDHNGHCIAPEKCPKIIHGGP